MKKILSVVLVALMIFSMASGVFAMVPSYDEDPTLYDFDQHVTMTVGDAEITQGTTTATVSVDMSDVPTDGLPDEGGVCAVEFWAIFDKKLDLDGIDLTTGMFNGLATGENVVVDSYASQKAKWTDASGTVSEYFLNKTNELWDIHGTTEAEVLANKTVYWIYICTDDMLNIHLGDGRVCDLKLTVPADMPVGEYDITVWTYCSGITGGVYDDFSIEPWYGTIDDTPGTLKVNAASVVTPTLKMSDATVTVGDAEATFTVTMENNPGFWSLKAYIIYPEALSIIQSSLTKGENFSFVTNFTTSGNAEMRDIPFATAKASSVNFDLEDECAAKGVDGTGKKVALLMMDLSSEDELFNTTDNGTVVTFKFNTATVAAGDYDIDLVLSGFNTIDCDSNDVHYDTVSGKLKVETCSHDWDLTSSTAATCTAASEENYECSLCHSTKTEHATAALGHEFNQLIETVDPTCTAEGYTTYKCSRCEETEDRDTQDKVDHDWNETSSTAATCTAASVENYECSMCHSTKTEHATDALGHEFNQFVEKVDPTCTAEGYTTYKCSRCEETEDRDTQGKVDHDWNETSSTAATCTAASVENYECSMCHNTKTEHATDALGHEFNQFVEKVDPTCTAEGYTTYKCSRCEETENRDTQDKIDHDWNQTASTAATCTAASSETYECSMCHGTKTEHATAALGHDFTVKGDTVAPTCTAEGYTTYKCSRCDATQNGDKVDALGHDWDAGVITKAPTTTEEGEKTFTCRRCGDKKVEPIEKLAEIKIPEDNNKNDDANNAGGSHQTGDALITVAIVAVVALIALAGTVVIKKRVFSK